MMVVVNSVKECQITCYLLVPLCTDSVSGWTRRKGGGGAKLPQQQAEDCDSLLWQFD